MNNYLSTALLTAALAFSLAGCDPQTSEEPGGTQVEKMAGRWEVTLDGLDAEGNVIERDPLGYGVVTIMTYNTSADTPSGMWLDDDGMAFAQAVRVDVDYAARTFSMDEIPVSSVSSGDNVMGTVSVRGKVLEGAARNLHGMPNDSIVYEMRLSDPDGAKTKAFRVSGQRYTGFYE